ncbi:MAG TPA: RNA polymerase sigma-54 factor, partial [Balneola sp.]|nr:RNA polymerase sigma-54 factor [Balneola sp.]
MLRNQQNISQKQQLGQQQKLSPQQLQFIKLLQLPTIALEQRIKEELELNPILEEAEPGEIRQERIEVEDEKPVSQEKEDGLETLEEHEVDWDDYDSNTEYEGESYSTPTHPDMQEWQDL